MNLSYDRKEATLMKNNIQEEISEFIEMCEYAYDSACSDDVGSAWDKVSTVFGNIIPGYYDGLNGPESPRGDMRLLDLLLITAKLRIFRAKLDYDAAMEKKDPSIATAALTASIDISVPFHTAIDLVVDDEEFDDEEKSVLIDQIKELKIITVSHTDKAAKWEKIRPVLSWLDGKGVRMADIMLPLISDAMK